MSLADLAAIGSFISGIAVLVSLIYLGLQVRQAKLHQQAAIRQGRADRIVQMCFEASDPSVAQAVAKGYAGADDITEVGSSRVDLQACKLEYSIVSPK